MRIARIAPCHQAASSAIMAVRIKRSGAKARSYAPSRKTAEVEMPFMQQIVDSPHLAKIEKMLQVFSYYGVHSFFVTLEIQSVRVLSCFRSTNIQTCKILLTLP